MEKKKVVPTWLSIVLVILCVYSVGQNIAGIVKTILNADSIDYHLILKLLHKIFVVASSILALVYCFKGYKKDANKIFKLCSIVFTITLLLQIGFKLVPDTSSHAGPEQPMIAEAKMPDVQEGEKPHTSGNHSDSVVIIFSTIMFGCMMVLSLAENLGKKKSLSLAGIIITLSLALVLITYNPNDLIVLILNVNFGTFINMVIYGIMVYAKYVDKEARGTK